MGKSLEDCDNRENSDDDGPVAVVGPNKKSKFCPALMVFLMGFFAGWLTYKFVGNPFQTPELSNSETTTTVPDLSNVVPSPFARPFPHPFMVNEYGFSDNFPRPKTTAELDLINLSISIREKPNWEEKINNASIIRKWEEELRNKTSWEWQPDYKLEYVLEELKYYLKLKSGSVEVAAVDGTWQSDALIDDELKNSFIKSVALLENVPDESKDWHPGSNKTVLDLVHPSLFPFVAKRTSVTKKPMKSLTDLKKGERKLQYASPEEIMTIYEAISYTLNHTIPFPSYTKSEKFQWLPSEFLVDPIGKVRIASYINNLHPEIHSDLYTSIERIFEKFIPLFNNVLTDLLNNRGHRIQVTRPSEEMIDENGKLVRIPNEISIPNFTPPSPASRTVDIRGNKLEVVPPTPPPTVVDLKGRKLQVIVKIGSIELTPEKPSYNGGVWHVEGMANERIVATGIYYYASSNIEESRLEFRQAISHPDYAQNDFKGVKNYYNISISGTPSNQILGSIITKEGRCIAFPNILQHKVTPFKLANPTQPGFRKILVFFLVDPSVRILSTERVPSQQYEWLQEEIRLDPENELLQSLDWDPRHSGPMDLWSAKKFREELMQERKYFINESNINLFERPFSLCEH